MLNSRVINKSRGFMKKKICIILIITVLLLVIIVGNINKKSDIKNDDVSIITSFYPLYIIALNITNEIPNVNVSNLTENQKGCIHDYILKVEDLKKIEKADIFIQNGKGIENFSDKILNSYPNVKIIDASENITDVISHDEEINAHFWTSIDNYILQVTQITNKLKELDTRHSELYNENYLKYISKMNQLKLEYEDKLKGLENKSIISLNESFSYLFKSLGINEILIETNHEQSSLSAEKVKEIIDKIRREDIKNIIIDEDDDEQNANVIKNETDIKIIKLKDATNGDYSLDSYIDIMKYNLGKLLEIE